MITKTFDEIIVERLKRSAAGLPFSDGRQISKHDQLLAQGALVSRAVMPWGGRSLYSVVNSLQTEAMFDGRRVALLDWQMFKPGGVQHHHLMVLMLDVAAGRLIVREPLNFLRCNDLPDIQMLPNLDPVGLEAIEVMVRYAVKSEDVVHWLEGQGAPIPDWLRPKLAIGEDQSGKVCDPPPEDELPGQAIASTPPLEKWSDELDGGGQIKLRLRIDAIQIQIQIGIEKNGWCADSLPEGVIREIKDACKSEEPKLFDKETSFENAWRVVVRILKKAKSHRHERSGGK